MKRSTKFYRKNEADVMESLGLKPTKNSGAGWIEKEDGQSDYLICQLKSTDASSIRIQQSDIKILENNAVISHKIPIFAIQFLNNGEVWIMAKPKDFCEVSEYLNTGKIEGFDLGIDLDDVEDCSQRFIRKIKSSGNAREQFHEEQNKRYDKTKYAK